MDGTSALCAQSDPELWFSDVKSERILARKICDRCPLKEPCLVYALDTTPEFGIFGGKSSSQRNKQGNQMRAERGMPIRPPAINREPINYGPRTDF